MCKWILLAAPILAVVGASDGSAHCYRVWHNNYPQRGCEAVRHRWNNPRYVAPVPIRMVPPIPVLVRVIHEPYGNLSMSLSPLPALGKDTGVGGRALVRSIRGVDEPSKSDAELGMAMLKLRYVYFLKGIK